jgi:hypothetical protein
VSPCFEGDPGPGYTPKDHGPYQSQEECEEDCSQLGACCTPTGCEQRTRCDCRQEDGNSFAGIGVSCEEQPCECLSCENCTADYSKVTLTITGLPADCLNRSENYDETDPYHKYVTRDLTQWNGCSFRLFQSGDNCVFFAILPGFHNIQSYCAGYDVSVELNLTTDSLRLRGARWEVVLRPENGKTFREFPYSGGVVVSRSDLTVCDLSDIQLTIDDSTPTFLPVYCPNGTGNCDEETDIIQRDSGLIPSYFPTCEACEEDAVTFISPATLEDESVPELTASLTFGEMDIDSLFEAGEPPNQTIPTNPGSIPGFSSISGSYSLKYGNAYYVARYGRARNSDWSLADTSGFFALPGGLNTAWAGCGWEGTFYSTPYGEEDTGKGYEMVSSDGSPLRALAAIQIAVVPIGWHMPHNYDTKQTSYTRCADGQVSHQVRISGHMIYSGFADSGFGYYVALGYWYPVFMYYGSVACADLTCRGKPSFTLSGDMYAFAPSVSFPNTYWVYATAYGKMSFPFSLSVS